MFKLLVRCCAICLVAALLVGCQSIDDLRGGGLDTDSADWSSGFRGPTGGDPMSGVTRKARDIERNLGYQ